MEVKPFSLSKYENRSKCEETIKNNDEFNNNSTKNVEIKKETQELRPKTNNNEDCNTEENKNQIQGFHINSAGYGMIPKLVMQDRNLSVISKAIYSYFCSYTGAGNTCFPSRKKICYDLNISKDRFAKHLAPLITRNYIKVEQTKEKGSNRFACNLYTLMDRVDSCACVPRRKNKNTESKNIEKTVSEPCRKNQYTESKNIEKTAFEPCLGFPDTENKSTKINNKIKINNNNYLRKKESKKKKHLEQDKISPKKEKNNSVSISEKKETKNKKINSSSISQKQTEAKKAKSKPISFDAIIDAYTVNEDLRKELKEHLKTRKRKKAALTNRAIELSLKELDRIADSDEEKLRIVQKSIVNGWIGFFELNEKDKNKLNNHSSYDLDEYVKAMDTFSSEPKKPPERLGLWL